jgi:hypothetical protein
MEKKVFGSFSDNFKGVDTSSIVAPFRMTAPIEGTKPILEEENF